MMEFIDGLAAAVGLLCLALLGYKWAKGPRR